MKRQVSSIRCDTFRALQLCSFLHNSRSSSFSTTTRRRVRMHQPSLLAHVDLNLRHPSFQSSQLLHEKYFNINRQLRLMSLSISSDDDSGEASAETNNGDIKSHEVTHLTSELGVQEMLGKHPIYYESATNDASSTTESLEFKSSEMLPYDDKIGFDMATQNITVSIDGIDANNTMVPTATKPVPSLVVDASGNDQPIDNVDVNDEYTDDKDSLQLRMEQPFDNNDEQQNPGAALQKLESNKKFSPSNKHPLISRLIKCIYDKDVRTAIKTFNKIMAYNKINERKKEPSIEIPPGLTRALLFLIEPGHPFEVYRVVQYYISLPTSHERSFGGTISDYKKYYRIACDSLRNLDPRAHYLNDTKLLVTALMNHIGKLDRSGQEMCVPVLLSAICEQPMSGIGNHFAGQIYKYLIDQKITVPDGYWVHLLSQSKYSRQDIPYDEILTKAVSLGLRPDPILVLNVLEHLFPFSDMNAVTTTLKALLTLQRAVAADIKEARVAAVKDKTIQVDDVVVKQYFVDVYLLETIGAAAASHGQSEINLLIWDMLDVLEYKPSVGIYENTVVSFAMNVFTYREAFTVLYEMETLGYFPSRALIRSFSVHARDSVRNMDFAQMQVMQLRQERNIKITTSIMNVLMSAAAERGDIDRLLSILKDFERYSVPFNADTISFGFESLGKNLMRRRNFNNTFLDQTRASTRDHIDACMVVANVLLNHMDDHQVKTTDHIIRNYIEFLCMAGHVETATSIILEAVQEKGLVSSKSIYRVAMANAKLFRFDVARQVATCDHSIAPLNFLLESIDREETLYSASLNAQHVKAEQTNSATTDFDPLPDFSRMSKNRNDYDRTTPVSSFWRNQSNAGSEH